MIYSKQAQSGLKCSSKLYCLFYLELRFTEKMAYLWILTVKRKSLSGIMGLIRRLKCRSVCENTDSEDETELSSRQTMRVETVKGI